MSAIPEIVFFFRKKNAGAFSINQLFESLAIEIGKSLDLRSVHLKKAGGGIPVILSNISHVSKESGNGINHITGDVHYAVLGIRKGKSVLTIHDCVLLSRTSHWNPKFYIYLWLWYKLPIGFADVVTTISEKSKREIVNFTGCKPHKIKVISNFVNEIFHHSPKTFNKICPRILQIGTFPNKNIERVAKALSGIPCTLEIIGELTPEQFEWFDKYQISIENTSNLSLEALAERYRQSDMVIFASTYEGFGMPIVEAQATGRPVVTSDIDPMPEVAGPEGACFVNPFDEDSIQVGVQRVIQEDSYRNHLIKTGLENVKRYALNNIAEQYMGVYRDLYAT